MAVSITTRITGMNEAQRNECPVHPLVVLFVEPDSIYKDMGLECYDEAIDARTYTGNLPVIAHPPCQRWGAMAAVNYARWGGEHNRPGNDGGLFRFALDTVNRCGGVLEHPAKTRAWKAHGLTKPTGIGWQKCGDGWTCEVWQSAYGHRANKATWLYLVGEPLPLRWERPRGSHQVGFHDQRGKARNKPTLGRKEARATPPKFAVALVELALACSKHNKIRSRIQRSLRSNTRQGVVEPILRCDAKG